jgi:uncharacterized protein
VKHFILIAFTSIVFILAPAVSAQAPPSAEKQKLIAEMIVIMKMDQQFPEIIDGVLKEMEKSYPSAFNAVIDGNQSFTAEQRAALKASSGERYAAFSQKFRKRLSEKVDYGKYIKESVYPLYDRFYTEQDLKDIIAFYKTPTGQKLISTLPAVMTESNKIATEKFVPMLVPIVQELLKEEFDQVGAPPKAVN